MKWSKERLVPRVLRIPLTWNIALGWKLNFKFQKLKISKIRDNFSKINFSCRNFNFPIPTNQKMNSFNKQRINFRTKKPRTFMWIPFKCDNELEFWNEIKWETMTADSIQFPKAREFHFFLLLKGVWFSQPDQINVCNKLRVTFSSSSGSFPKVVSIYRSVFRCFHRLRLW